MPRKIDTAYVEYLPDFSAFTRETDRQLRHAFDGVERIAESSARDVEVTFDEMGEDVEAVFRELARTGIVSFGDIDTVATEVADDIGREFQQGGERAEDAFTELRRTADSNLDRMDRRVRQSASATGRQFNIAGLVSGAALLGVGAAAVAGLGALATMGLMAAASLEQTQVSFNALLGSAEKGAEVFKGLQDFAAKTPFEFPEVANAAKRFFTFADAAGMAKDQVFQFLTTVGDIASVTGAGAEGMNRIALALGQIASKGKTSLEEIMQISEAVPGFSGVAAIAAARGTSTAQAMQDISAGAVGAQEGIAALLAGMQKFPGAAGAMEKQSQTLLGVFSTFKDVVGQTLAGAFAPAIPAIKNTITQITPIIGEALGQIAPALGALISGLLPLLGELIKGIAPILTPILNVLGPALSALAPVLAPLGAAIGKIIEPLTPLIPIVAEFAVILIQLLVPILQLLGLVLIPLKPVLEFIAKAIGELGKAISRINWGSVGKAIGGAFSDAWDAVKEFFVGIGRWFSKLPEQIGEFFSSLPERIGDAFQQMFDQAMLVIGAGIAVVIFTITQLPMRIMRGIATLPLLVSSFFANLWTNVWNFTANIWNNIITFIHGVPGKIGAALSALPGVIAKQFHTAFDRGKAIVRGAIDAIVSFWRSIPSRLSSFASNIGGGIVSFFKNFLNRAIDGVNRGITAIDDWLPGSLPRIPRLAKGGIAFGPSMIAENSSASPEAAIPLGDPRALAILKQALGSDNGGVTFSPGAIVVNVTGDMSASQATKIGQSIGTGIASTLNIRNAVRMAG